MTDRKRKILTSEEHLVDRMEKRFKVINLTPVQAIEKDKVEITASNVSVAVDV